MQFRAYFIDEHEHVRGAIDIEAESLLLALEQAKVLNERTNLELWQLDRFLCRFERMPEQAGLWQ